MRMIELKNLEKNNKVLARREGEDFLLFNPTSRQIVFLKEEAYQIWDSFGDNERLKTFEEEVEIKDEVFQDFLKNLIDKELVYVKKSA